MENTIKTATLADLSDINQLLRLSKGYWSYSEEALDRFMQSLGITQEYLASHDIKLFYVGQHLAGFYNFNVDDQGGLVLDNFFLHPDNIGKGLGRALWNECCQSAIQQGKEEFIIWSDLHAEGFYLKMGCKKIGERQSVTLPDKKSPILKCGLRDVIAKDQVEIVPYNPSWPHDAQVEIQKLKAILPLNSIIDIQHVGSTAIPGMSAKPIIDIQIAAKSLDEMKSIVVPLLQKIGYKYWADNPDPDRMFFVKGMPPYGEKRTHHVHIFELTSKHWEGKILFRDYLIAHPEVAKEYEQLKMDLAQQHTFDREQYTEAKGEFVSRILKLAKE